MSHITKSCLDVPVLLLIYNRPDCTKAVLDSLKAVKPVSLYVAADGPKSNCAVDEDKCARTRALLNHISWDCELKTLYHDENHGCKWGPITGINWFFEHVPEGIILEDDCIAHPSFFPYCGELLKRYRNNPQIMHIGGNNYQQGQHRGDSSYYFSYYPHIWGWATWKRAWEFFTPSLTDVKFGPHLGFSKIEKAYWRLQFLRLNESVWDFQWTYTLWKQNGLAITPNVNLVANIGFGTDATHTRNPGDKRLNLPVENIWPLTHPETIKPDYDADRFTSNNLFIRGKSKLAASLCQFFYRNNE